MKKLALTLFAFAALAPAAVAGGFATVGLSSLPPANLKAGDTWAVDVTVLAHGRTPVEHAQPVVRLRGPGGAVEEFAATRTGKPGVYHAVVAFPANGTWTYEVWDGYSQTHTYKPIEVAAATAATSGTSFPTLPVAGVLLGLLLVLALVLILRRVRTSPQPAPLGR